MKAEERTQKVMSTRTAYGYPGGVRRQRLVSGACLGALLGGLLWLVGLSPANAAASAWSVVTSPNQGTSNNLLNGVSCASPSSCTAVGYYTSSTALQTLAESWNGTKWSIATSPNKGTSTNILNGVSCASSTSCTAVGYYTNTSGTSQTLAESWNGTKWSIATSPNKGTSNNILQGASCASPTSCTAVGYYTNTSTSTFRTLAESWNGTKWSVVPSPSKGTGNSQLQGTSCTSSSSCMAVGTYINTSTNASRTLAESWNGTKWSIVPSPNKLASYNSLQGVSCASSSSCTAAGTGANTSQTLAESWNGTKWAVVTSPSKGTSVNFLFGVSCASSSSCMAVGFYDNSAAARTLIERS
jgi:hypothetical protein